MQKQQELASFKQIDCLREVKTYGDKKYHILIEKYKFRLLQHDKELHAYCVDYFDYGMVVDLDIKL